MELRTAVVAIALAASQAGAQANSRADIFVGRGCTECYAIAALGTRAATDVAPDLTFAYADVVNRYAVNLESFLNNPTGVMRPCRAS